MRRDKYLLAIPVYNEERYVARVISEAKRYIAEILVVDDGSTDATPQLLQDTPDISVIRHPCNLGYGRSLREAFDYASGLGYEWLITMDCDEQHEPSAIPAFVAAAEVGDADIVSGSRYLRPLANKHRPPPDRRAINRRITRLLNAHLGLQLTDAFCGFKAYRTAVLPRLQITVPGYAMPLQLWVQAARARLRIMELPVRLIYKDPARHFGGSLDDPAMRYAHYLEVLNAELAASRPAAVCEAISVCQAC